MNQLRVILSVDAIARPLTGIGRYALELATRIDVHPRVQRRLYFSMGRWVEDPVSLLVSPPLTHWARSRMSKIGVVQKAYRVLSPAYFGLRLRRYSDYIFHSPNYFLPPTGGRAITTIHDLSAVLHPQYHPSARADFMRAELPNTLQRADLVITDSEFVRQEVIQHFSWPANRIVAIPLGVSEVYRPHTAAETTAVLKKFGLAHGGYTLTVATIEPRKNLGSLIEAYEQLPASLRDRYPLVLAGDYGWKSEAIHDRIRQLESKGWLRYIGYVDEAELPSLYAGARGFAYPSYYEGFGLPVLEAMACGIPVLASNRSSLPELAQGTALLVEPEDIKAITHALERLLDDDTWRRDAAPQVRLVAGRYTWQTTAERTIDAYERLALM